MEEINKQQVQKMFVKLDEIEDVQIKKDIFYDLGKNCYTCRSVDKWIGTYGNDIDKMIDWVASDKSPYWEKLEFDEKREKLYLTGKEVESCPCEYNSPEKAVESLCHYCCKSFQETLWSDLLKKKVTVEITESVILGGKRCNTIIHIK
jgi:hypothetical protein